MDVHITARGRSSSTKYRNVPVRMTFTGGAHHHSLTYGWSLCNRSLNQSSWSWSRRILLTTPGSSILANPVSNQNHKVIVPSHRSENRPSTRVVFRGEWIYECCLMPPAFTGIPVPSGGFQQPSNQAVIATCHALRLRQRYCQTRYTRRYRFIQPALYQRDMSGNTSNLAYRQAGQIISL